MCAIMGIIDKSKEIDLSIIKKMQKVLYHRGPNDNGELYFNLENDEHSIKNIAIGFDRLSIRDLSSAGHQPMFYGDDIFIAFNGEIYNSEDYRNELLNKGYKFKGHSDTEIILALYHCYGLDEMLKRLDGMFAICLVDLRIHEMYLIRDRIGEKPLYIYQKDGLMLFASEYKAFYAHPEFKAELDEENIDEYLMFRYVSGNDTLLKNVKNLEPGHYIKLNLDGISEHEYWTLPEYNPNKLSFAENKKKIEELIDLSTKRRLISDVPVGLQLSGGVDSSYIASVIKKHIKNDLQTFGIVFDDAKYSEEKYMDTVINKFSCVPNKFKFNSETFLDLWKDTTWYFEAPMNHEGSMGLIMLNRKAKETVTVMLCGEGADESLAGYGRFSDIVDFKNKPFKSISKQFIKKILSSFSDNFNFSGFITLNEGKYLISKTQYVSNKDLLNIRPNSLGNIKQIYKKRLSIFNRTKGKGLRKYINYEMRTYLRDILMRTDKTSMASSLELRVPFLMPGLIEFESTVPERYLVSNSKGNPERRTKKILKELCADTYGEDFTYRHKCGFGMPLLDYFKFPENSKFVDEKILPGVKKRGIINYTYIEQLWNNIKNTNSFGRQYYKLQQIVWVVFSFELWAQMYIDNSPLDYDIYKSRC